MLRSLEQHEAVARELAVSVPAIEALARAICDCLAKGGRVLTFGNGGSAAEAQHLAAELVGRTAGGATPLPAMALCADAAVLTAIANDHGFTDVFARQVRALATRQDIVIGISTSGRSENVLRALANARELHAVTGLLAGAGGTEAAALVDHAVIVPSRDVARIQEMHALVVHLICETVDAWASAKGGPAAQR